MPKYQTGEEYYNKIYLVFNALIAATLFPFVVLFLNIERNGTSDTILNDEPAYLLASILLLIYTFLFYTSIKSYKKELSHIKKDRPLREKLDNYYSVSLKKYFKLTICCALMVLGLLLTKYFLFIIGYILALVVLSIGRPVLNSIISEIPLNESEINILNNKDVITPE
ncbi:hypothetical protein [Reichenbachiella sp. MALMAid0571]|uniref:hypothetical protein n=1 Tax=Reichenbachiella sp. MALMAid0571 TaxID=3143939 RepID=UPI0032E01DC8